MINIFDFIKSTVVVVTTIISVLNPFNISSQNTTPVERPSSTPVQKTNIDTSSDTLKDNKFFINTQNIKGVKDVPKPSSSSIDSDPIVTCNSKTGKNSVRLSICKSYTDCPDGHGGYVFESQGACKSRWTNIGKQYKNITDDYIKAIKERGELESLQRELQTQQFDNELKNKLQQQSQETDQFIKDLENKSLAEYQKILDQQREDFKNFIKTPAPTPCLKGWYGAEIDIEGPCGN